MQFNVVYDSQLLELMDCAAEQVIILTIAAERSTAGLSFHNQAFRLCLYEDQ